MLRIILRQGGESGEKLIKSGKLTNNGLWAREAA